MQWLVGALCGLAFGAIALFGERWTEALRERRLRLHHCPTGCLESMRCRCGCNGLHSVGARQDACAVCATPIAYDEEAEITQETYWRWP